MSKKNKRNMQMSNQEAPEESDFAEVAIEESAEEALVEFDGWWAMVKNNVPRQHRYKEIIWADFQSRGLSKAESTSTYDAALKKYGINI